MTCTGSHHAHHWHCGDHAGRERELVTVGRGKVAAVCCHCGARAHVFVGAADCGFHAEPDAPSVEQQASACCMKGGVEAWGP